MRILKSHPLLKLVNAYLVDASQPSNISYLWNFGSLLAVCLIIQIITGITLAMHYSPNVLEAFNSIEHIMRDVNNGWLLRYLHSNTASAFFFLVYLHIGRGIYYGSYRAPRTLVWVLGTIIFILMIGTGFLGYLHSPKWFNINIFNIYVLFIIFIYIIERKFEDKSKIRHIIRQLKCNKVRNGLYNEISLIRKSAFIRYQAALEVSLRKYSISCYTNKDIEVSDRLEEIIKELGLNPVYIFENLNSENTRKQVLKDTKGLSGIYMIVNKMTKDYYIGSAATNRFYSRFSNHLIYFRGSKIVKLAIKKYNLENFAFLVLELYPNIITKENNKELIDLEDKYLKLLIPNYNILTEAGSSFGYKHTEIDRQKMKDIYTEARRERIGSLNKGKKLYLETIEKIREKALRRPLMSEETKQKCINHTRPITLYNLDSTIYGEYSTILAAAKAINCSEKTIRRALQTEKKLVKKQWIVKDFNK